MCLLVPGSRCTLGGTCSCSTSFMATFLNACWAERLERAADPRCAPRCLAFAVWTAGSMALTSLTRFGWRRSGTGKFGTTHFESPAPTTIATAHGRHTSIERSSSCRDDCSHPSSPLEAIGVRSRTPMAATCAWRDNAVQSSRSE